MQAKVNIISTRTHLIDLQSKINKELLPFDLDLSHEYADLIELESNLWQSDEKIREIASQLGLYEELRWF